MKALKSVARTQRVKLWGSKTHFLLNNFALKRLKSFLDLFEKSYLAGMISNVREQVSK